MDKQKNTPNNPTPDEQHTRQFDAVITPRSGQRNILRPNEPNAPQPPRDPNNAQNRPASNGGQNILRPSSPEPNQVRPSQNTGRSAPIPVSKPVTGRRTGASASVSKRTAAVSISTPEPTRKQTAEQKKSRIVFFSILFAAILLATTLITTYALGCANDILALNRSADKVSILVTEQMDANDIVSLLKEKGLIKNKTFCKLFVKFMDYDDTEFMPGIHELRGNMGLEGMLGTIKSSRTSNETVMLVFPEGYTVDQIFAKLEQYKVCSASSLYSTLNEVDFSKDFSFIKDITNKTERYRYLEGFLYPDTYNFYIGENASSVIRKFLNNFEKRWTEEYAAQAKKRNMTIDQVITLASIIEKEGKDQEQMVRISGILSNRMQDKMRLECDSTYGYIVSIDKALITTTQYDKLYNAYNTYSISALPPGAICNPGDDAINAALFPATTDNYYFRHDKAGKIYYANTLAQHNANERLVNEANANIENP